MSNRPRDESPIEFTDEDNAEILRLIGKYGARQLSAWIECRAGEPRRSKPLSAFTHSLCLDGGGHQGDGLDHDEGAGAEAIRIIVNGVEREFARRDSVAREALVRLGGFDPEKTQPTVTIRYPNSVPAGRVAMMGDAIPLVDGMVVNVTDTSRA